MLSKLQRSHCLYPFQWQKPAMPSYFYVGTEIWTQIFNLVLKALLPTESPLYPTFFDIWDKVSYSSGLLPISYGWTWPWTHDSPTCTSLVLRLLACTTKGRSKWLNGGNLSVAILKYPLELRASSLCNYWFFWYHSSLLTLSPCKANENALN